MKLTADTQVFKLVKNDQRNFVFIVLFFILVYILFSFKSSYLFDGLLMGFLFMIPPAALVLYGAFSGIKSTSDTYNHTAKTLEVSQDKVKIETFGYSILGITYRQPNLTCVMRKEVDFREKKYPVFSKSISANFKCYSFFMGNQEYYYLDPNSESNISAIQPSKIIKTAE